MAFTAKLGSGSSMPGNILLAAHPPTATLQSFTGSMSFTGAFTTQIATSQGFIGSLGLSGSLEVRLRGQPSVHVIELVDRPNHTITLEAG